MLPKIVSACLYVSWVTATVQLFFNTFSIEILALIFIKILIIKLFNCYIAVEHMKTLVQMINLCHNTELKLANRQMTSFFFNFSHFDMATTGTGYLKHVCQCY